MTFVLLSTRTAITPPPSPALTTFSAASARLSADRIGRPDSARIFLPSSTFVPSSRTTSGTCRLTSRAAATTPSAITSQRMMPPKMLTRMPSTLASDRMILKAAVTRSRVRAAADVEEVRRLPAVELDDVHGRHGEAGTVDHAADLAVELDVVEAVARRLELRGVLLRFVAQLLDVLCGGTARCRRSSSWRRAPARRRRR